MTQKFAWLACLLSSVSLVVWLVVSAAGDRVPAHAITRIEGSAETLAGSAPSPTSARSATSARAERSDGAPMEVDRAAPSSSAFEAEPFALVVDLKGRPVPHALLELFDSDEWYHRIRDPEAPDPRSCPPGRSFRLTADEQGLVYAPLACEGGFNVRALDSHCNTEPLLWIEFPLSRGTPLFELRVTAAARVDGVVFDEAGAPIASGTVYLLQDDERIVCNGPQAAELIPSALVGPDGRFELGGLQAGTGWSAVVLADGFRPAHSNSFALAAGEHRTVELRAGRGACITGRTVDEHGYAVADVGLGISYSDDELRARMGWKEWPTRRFRSGLDGQFVVHGLPEGYLRLYIEDPAYLPYVPEESSPLTLAVDEQRGNVIIVAKKGIEFDCRIVDGHRQPMPGATVRFRGLGGRHFFRFGPLTTVTDECGRFRLSCFDRSSNSTWETVVVEVEVPGQVDDIFHVPFKEHGDHELKIEMGRSRTARLRVIDAENLRPISGYSVSYGRYGTRQSLEVQNPEGRCSVDGVFESLWISSSDYESKDFEIAEDASAGEETVIRLTRSKSWPGRVTDEQDRPVSNASVWIGYASTVSARSDAEGRFLLQGLSWKHVRLRVEHPSFQRLEEEYDLSVGTPLVVKLRRGGFITGRVLDEQGRPCTDCFVAAERGSFTYPIQAEALMKAKTDDEGRYELTSLEPAMGGREYIVSVVKSGEPWALLRSPNREVRSVCVLPGTKTRVDLILRQKRFGALRGRLLGADGSPVRAMVSVEAIDGQEFRPAGPGPNKSSTDAFGCFEIGELRPGSILVEARIEGLGIAYFDAEIAAERTTELEMRWPQGSVEVRLQLLPSCTSTPETSVYLVPQDQSQRGSSNRSSRYEIDEIDAPAEVFTCVPPGRYRVFVEPRKHELQIGCAWSDPFDLSADASLVTVKLAIPPSCPVHIEVVDAVSGAPIPGAVVRRTFGPARSWYPSWSVDENGTLAVPEAAAGRLELWIASDVHAAQMCALDVTAESSMHRVALARGACVRIVVADAADAPVSGARVILRQPPRAKGTYDLGFHREPLSAGDFAGLYELQNLPAGRYTVRAEFGTQNSGDIEFEVPASGSCEVRLVLR